MVEQLLAKLGRLLGTPRCLGLLRPLSVAFSVAAPVLVAVVDTGQGRLPRRGVEIQRPLRLTIWRRLACILPHLLALETFHQS